MERLPLERQHIFRRLWQEIQKPKPPTAAPSQLVEKYLFDLLTLNNDPTDYDNGRDRLGHGKLYALADLGLYDKVGGIDMYKRIFLRMLDIMIEARSFLDKDEQLSTMTYAEAMCLERSVAAHYDKGSFVTTEFSTNLNTHQPHISLTHILSACPEQERLP